MNKPRGAAVLIAAFVVVLLGGAALAGVGAIGPATGADDTAARTATPPDLSALPDVALEVPATTSPDQTEPKSSEPTEDPKDEGDDEQVDEPRPELEIVILRPENGATVHEPVIGIKGLTHPRATLNLGRRTIDVDHEGMWHVEVELEQGENVFVFHASLGDQEADARLKVVYEKPIDKRFTANQKYEASDDSPPYNVYWGTGTPGAEVVVKSRFGRGATEVNEEGHWELRVTFPEAPCNETFGVVAMSGDAANEFRMKRICRTDHVFTAHQKWEISDDEPAMNIYYGTARPGAEVWVGSEYGSGHTKANENGTWELEVRFPEAPCNQWFAVVVESGDHRKVFEMKRVCREDVEFTANQKYGSCGEEIPYDVFWGTATPGAKIWIESAYGGGTAIANEKGHWEKRIEFPEAPVGETFKIFIESSDGGEAVFTFTRTGGDGDH